jgi:hypothetical protein
MSSIDENVIPLTAIGSIFGLPFVGLMLWIIIHYSCMAFRSWQEIGLKREMIDRGYTAQEIIAVMEASGSKTGGPNVPPAKPIKQPAL